MFTRSIHASLVFFKDGTLVSQKVEVLHADNFYGVNNREKATNHKIPEEKTVKYPFHNIKQGFA